MTIETRNPATGKTIKQFKALTEDQIDAALARSQAAFQIYRNVPMTERAEYLLKVADILEAEAGELSKIITTEMGKTRKSAEAEVRKCAWVCRYYAEHAPRQLADDPVEIDGKTAFRRYLPLGPILAVMPWNYPFWQVFRFAAPILMAGNTGLLKHASNVPQCALAIEDVLRRAGYADGVFQTLLISGSQVEHVLRDPRVKAATLTGSEAAGASVASICGEEIKPTLLELGGSDAFIIMPSADIDKAVEIGTRARTQNNGQSCIAAKRIIIQADIYDDVRDKFIQAFENLSIGDPMDDRTDIGPLVNANARMDVLKFIEDAVSKGSDLITGGQALNGDGYYFSPGLLENIPDTARVYREEVFAPLGLLFKVQDLAEAIALANDSEFGLGSAIFTRDKAEMDQAIDQLEAGATFVNSMTSSDPRLPFGGIKKSGYGRELAEEGIRTFCNIKTVSIED